jgi:ArsR family transcriptional regulator
MADIFDVISDATRREVLLALLERFVDGSHPTGDISVGDLVERLGLTQPTVSKHLKVLRDHDLVSVREEGQHRFYRLESTPLEVVDDWLAPFLDADVHEAGGEVADSDGAVFAAWSGVDVGQTIGRRVAEGTHSARTVIHGATEQVGRRLPKIVRKRPFSR